VPARFIAVRQDFSPAGIRHLQVMRAA
jgi:hypothetical protein